MTDTLISDEMRGALGRQLRTRASFPISVSDIRRWAQAVYFPLAPPPEFWDEAHETTKRNGGIVAPEEFNPFAWMTAEGPPPEIVTSGSGFGGPEMTLGVTPPPTNFLLNGGQAATYTGVYMRPGDVIVSVTRLKEYRERPGRLGQMLFTVTEDEWTNQRGEVVKTTEGTLIRY